MSAPTARCSSRRPAPGGRDGVVCVVLGRGANDAKVDHWLAQAAPVDGFVGFAIGRSIWWDPLKAYVDGKIERRAAAQRIAENYLRFVKVYERAEGRRCPGAGERDAGDEDETQRRGDRAGLRRGDLARSPPPRLAAAHRGAARTQASRAAAQQARHGPLRAARAHADHDRGGRHRRSCSARSTCCWASLEPPSVRSWRAVRDPPGGGRRRCANSGPGGPSGIPPEGREAVDQPFSPRSRIASSTSERTSSVGLPSPCWRWISM